MRVKKLLLFIPLIGMIASCNGGSPSSSEMKSSSSSETPITSSSTTSGQSSSTSEGPSKELTDALERAKSIFNSFSENILDINAQMYVSTLKEGDVLHAKQYVVSVKDEEVYFDITDHYGEVCEPLAHYSRYYCGKTDELGFYSVPDYVKYETKQAAAAQVSKLVNFKYFIELLNPTNFTIVDTNDEDQIFITNDDNTNEFMYYPSNEHSDLYFIIGDGAKIDIYMYDDFDISYYRPTFSTGEFDIEKNHEAALMTLEIGESSGFRYQSTEENPFVSFFDECNAKASAGNYYSYHFDEEEFESEYKKYFKAGDTYFCDEINFYTITSDLGPNVHDAFSFKDCDIIRLSYLQEEAELVPYACYKIIQGSCLSDLEVKENYPLVDPITGDSVVAEKALITSQGVFFDFDKVEETLPPYKGLTFLDALDVIYSSDSWSSDWSSYQISRYKKDNYSFRNNAYILTEDSIYSFSATNFLVKAPKDSEYNRFTKADLLSFLDRNNWQEGEEEGEYLFTGDTILGIPEGEFDSAKGYLESGFAIRLEVSNVENYGDLTLYCGLGENSNDESTFERARERMEVEPAFSVDGSDFKEVITKYLNDLTKDGYVYTADDVITAKKDGYLTTWRPLYYGNPYFVKEGDTYSLYYETRTEGVYNVARGLEVPNKAADKFVEERSDKDELNGNAFNKVDLELLQAELLSYFNGEDNYDYYNYQFMYNVDHDKYYEKYGFRYEAAYAIYIDNEGVGIECKSYDFLNGYTGDDTDWTYYHSFAVDENSFNTYLFDKEKVIEEINMSPITSGNHSFHLISGLGYVDVRTNGFIDLNGNYYYLNGDGMVDIYDVGTKFGVIKKQTVSLESLIDSINPLLYDILTGRWIPEDGIDGPDIFSDTKYCYDLTDTVGDKYYVERHKLGEDSVFDTNAYGYQYSFSDVGDEKMPDSTVINDPVKSILMVLTRDNNLTWFNDYSFDVNVPSVMHFSQQNKYTYYLDGDKVHVIMQDQMLTPTGAVEVTNAEIYAGKDSQGKVIGWQKNQTTGELVPAIIPITTYESLIENPGTKELMINMLAGSSFTKQTDGSYTRDEKFEFVVEGFNTFVCDITVKFLDDGNTAEVTLSSSVSEGGASYTLINVYTFYNVGSTHVNLPNN